MNFILLFKSKWTVFKKKISTNAMKSGSKEWISALVYKDITSNKCNKIVSNWANSIANLKTFRVTQVDMPRGSIEKNLLQKLASSHYETVIALRHLFLQ